MTVEGAGYTAGIVHFGSDAGLAECLASLRAQSVQPRKIIVVDHSARPAGSGILPATHADVVWIFDENRGYAGGANRLIGRTRELCPDAAFVLVLNSDVQLDPGFAENLLREVVARPEVALASGKLLRPGRALIDSAGIVMRRSRRFEDRGSEEPDDGRYGSVESVFAVSGAAMMLRVSSLPDLSIEGEIFDEDFFLYHEDTDLAWRARRLGYSSLYVPEAVGIHVRGWRRGHRGRVSTKIRRHSFKNRYLELIKNERPLGLLRNLPFIVAAEVARLGFALVADRGVLGGYRDALDQSRRAWRKRRVISRKARVAARSPRGRAREDAVSEVGESVMGRSGG